MNPFLGVLIHGVGAILGGSFYVPFSRVKQWSWETYWLLMGIPAWVVLPWLAAWLTVPNATVYSEISTF